MFGHDNHDEQQQNNQGHDGAVTVPAEPATDDALGLSDESVSSTPSSAPAADDPSTGFIMEPVKSAAPDPVAPAAPPPTTAAEEPSASSDELLRIKQEALQHLSPLLGHLEQNPEEKFRTTMMMIQASDDQTMVGQAYAAAQAIPDEKVRAQALLDIVNEINYFTQQHKDKQ